MIDDTRGSTASDEIDAILRDSAELIMAIEPTDIATGPTSQALSPFLEIKQMDYDTEQQRARKSAKKAMDSLLKFYLSEDVINKNEYARARAKLAAEDLGVLMFQLKHSEQTILTLVKTIHAGNAAPRMYEVLATMQKAILDNIKTQALTLLATEETMKRIRAESQSMREIGTVSIQATQSKMTRGTRDLMKGIQDELSKEENFDV
jgi:hypothetical protein